MRCAAALLPLAALAACHSAEQPQPQPSAEMTGELPTRPAPTVPSPSVERSAAAAKPPVDLTVLESRDCRTVAQAYFDALGRGDTLFATRVWNDSVIDAAQLQALLRGYKQPRVAITGVEQEGAAGSSYCTVSGTLTDAGNPTKPAEKGQIVLRRVNDVPGATPDQLRWTIQSSTFVQALRHAGAGAPA